MTSLSQQLKKLAVPQTSALVDLKKRPSILFDLKEAATKDRKTIFDIGTQGLSELIRLNHEFAQFEQTLFQHSSIHLERSMEDAAFNEILNKNIQKFFHHLSPYFMIRSAHMCLEWLIRRYQVHEYNKDAFMCLILPYHETNIFVKCVQICKLKTASDPWHWMQPIQKPGVPLTKATVLKKAASDPNFLSLICANMVGAMKELGPRASTLQCLMNFYCSTVVGMFETCGEVKEWHMTTVLPSVFKGMKSGVVDLIAATFMITTQIVSKTKVTEKLLNLFVTQICRVNCPSLQSSQLLLLSWIAKTQESLIRFPQGSFTEFIANKWLTPSINALYRECSSMEHLLVPLVHTAVDLIQQTNGDVQNYQDFLEGLLYGVQLSPSCAKRIISMILEACPEESQRKSSFKSGEVIDLDDESENDNTTGWYLKVLQILERQYSGVIDEIIKEIFQNISSPSTEGYKLALTYRYKSSDANSVSTFQNIYSSNPKVRAIAMNEIVNQVNDGNEESDMYRLLKEILSDRIKDDNAKVIEEVLKLPSKVFVDVLGCKTFVEQMINILDKSESEVWNTAQVAALTHLVSDAVVNDYDPNLILLSIMRFLLPVNNNNEHAECIKIILDSPFIKCMPFLKKVAKTFKKKTLNPVEFKKEFLNILTVSDDIPNLDSLIESVKSEGQNHLKTAIQVSHFLMVVTVSFKSNNTPEKAHRILNFATEQCNHFKITHFNKSEWTSAFSSKAIPLQLFMDFLHSLVRGTSFESVTSWEAHPHSLELFLDVFNVLTSNAFSANANEDEKRDWTKGLRDVLNLLFPTLDDKVNILSQFFLYETWSSVKDYIELRIRAIRLLDVILKGKSSVVQLDLRFILKVIVALSSPVYTVRKCALDILQTIQGIVKTNELKFLVEQVYRCSEEILCDSEQIPLIMYTVLCQKNKKEEGPLLVNILRVIEDPGESLVLKSKVLEVLKHIKSMNILKCVIPVAISALNNVNSESGISILDNASADVFKSVIVRFEENFIQEIVASDKRAWQLIENSIKMSKTYTSFMKEKLVPVPCVTMEIFDEATYAQLPTSFKIRLLKLLIETVANSDNDALFLNINKALRRCSIDCKHMLPLLESMQNICTKTEPKRSSGVKKEIVDDMNFTTSPQWKEGVVLLELLESKKKLQNGHLIISIVFDILKKCLDMENQAPLEYTKQLILSVLLQCCKSSEVGNLLRDIPENSFRIDLVVQCIRITQNPQTHYNALLLLSHCAVLFPQQVLHNLVDIFTFMGSSIARHDDAFSFQVISNIIESIIPILVKERNSAVKDRVVPVLKIFSDIILDVPEHRRIPLYSKLMDTLGADEYFWMFLCLVFESHVNNEEKEKLNSKKKPTPTASGEKMPKRLEIALQLLHEFNIYVSLQTCVSLMDYLKGLPMNKGDEGNTPSRQRGESSDSELFNIKARSDKQLRHYKYLILQSLSTFTSSVEFLRAVSLEEKSENKSTKSLYQNFIIKTLSYIPEINTMLEKNTDASQSKFWKVILHHCYDTLDNVISLLTPDMFLVVVNGLMVHKLITIRKKVIELLISKLQLKNGYFEKCSDENVLNVLHSLRKLIGTIVVNGDGESASLFAGANASEGVLVQQAGLIAVKLLSKLFSLKYIEEFKNIIVVLTNITKNRMHISKVIFATVILTLVELTANLKAHAIVHLPKFMPHLVDALRDQAATLKKHPPDNVCLALVTGNQKLFETMPLFLGPYIVGIVTALSTIWARIDRKHTEQEQRKELIKSKLHLIWSKIASGVPARVLVPNCERSYFVLMENKTYSSIGLVMKLLLECVSNSTNADLAGIQSELTEFFLKSFEFRSDVSMNASVEEVELIETEIISAFVAWILKLSEGSFRPLYKKVHDWAISSDGPKERVLTYFILNRNISDALKSLFVMFAGDYVTEAANFLTACNTIKNKSLYFPDSLASNTQLVKNIVDTLSNIFVHGTKTFVNPHRFDILMQPIVDQLENSLVLENDDLQSSLIFCTGQLAAAVSSDILWKQLNYQVLLKTRTNKPQVRILAIKCCVEFARKLGDDFTSLLPETIPFVAELFEDENPEVVKSSTKAVQELEVILGEPLQKYL